MTGTRRGGQNFFSNFSPLPLQHPVFGARIPPDQTPGRGKKNLFNKNATEKNVSSHVCVCAPANSAPDIRTRGRYASRFRDGRQPMAVSRWHCKAQTVFVCFQRKIRNHTVDSYDHL